MEKIEDKIKEMQFVGFISDLTNTGLQYLGRLKNPRTNEFIKNLSQAERMIYILDMLIEKTRNNLTSMETEHLQISVNRLKKTFYEEKQMSTSESVNIRHILVDSEFRANDILVELKNGADFAEIAKLHSQSYSADNGFIEELKKGDFPKSIEDVAFNLKENEISGTIHSVLGFHIIKKII